METGWIYGLLLALFNGAICFLIPIVVATSQTQRPPAASPIAEAKSAQAKELTSQEVG
ncbi:MAG: hypothetical protein HC825_12040 [Oscillatoriales cyanobacterium RM1_1_9]|nr:hypothetical protein [Oscillatoriales cyanobacterium SM2_3_0]NJO72198.1 hypothetical protein [Oscillatoriales cyanobacterium RM1_1_9]